ncbi:MAG: hypothetical protein GX029_07515, partial [Pseudomonadaceae bacterium]|nr:hypothetical protein [Pseudomonadaceae bacterium]
MKFLKPQLVWPLISGLLFAALLLQAFPSLTGQTTTNPASTNQALAEIHAGEPLLVARQEG